MVMLGPLDWGIKGGMARVLDASPIMFLVQNGFTIKRKPHYKK